MSEAKPSQIAMATPAAVFAVGGLCFGLFALLAGIVSPAAIPVIAGWAMVVGGTVLICGIIDTIRGDILLGSTCLILGGLIGMGSGTAFHVVVSTPQEMWAAGLGATGWVWVAIGLILLALLPCYGKVSWSLFLFMLELVVIAFLLGVGLITGAPMGTGIMALDGWLLLIFGLYCIYAATVFVTNTVYGAPKLPIGGPLFK